MALIQCPECGRNVSDQATSCPGCGAPLQTQPAAQPQPTPQPQPQPQPIYQAPRKSHFGLIATIIAVVVLFIAAAATLPDREQHSKAVKESVDDLVDNKLQADSTGISSMIASAIMGNEIYDDLAEKLIYTRLKYHSYIVFSTCSLKFHGKSTTVSFGCFGHVWALGLPDLDSK